MPDTDYPTRHPLLSVELVVTAIVVLPIAITVCVIAAPVIGVASLYRFARQLRKH